MTRIIATTMTAGAPPRPSTTYRGVAVTDVEGTAGSEGTAGAAGSPEERVTATEGTASTAGLPEEKVMAAATLVAAE